MPAARRGRRLAAIAVSAAAHLVVLTVLALHAPTLLIPPGPSGPPEPIIPVLLVPRLPPPVPAAGTAPAPIRLHRRQLRVAAPELPVKPLPAPEPKPTPPTPPGPVTLRPAPLPEGPKEQLRTALRRGPIGCANPQAFQLSREERVACDEQLANGAAAAAFPGLGLSAGKQGALDKAGARKEADRRYRETTPPLTPGDTKGSSGEPSQVLPDPHR
jgi:hypothetical protein